MKSFLRLVVSIFAVTAALATQFLIAPSAYASAAATATCSKTYPPPSSTTQQASTHSACVDGYDNGVGDGSVCRKYDNPGQNQACRSGYDLGVIEKRNSGTQTPGGTQTPTNGTQTPAAPAAGSQTPTTTAPPADSGDDSDDKDAVTCAVEKIGWIVCPIIEQSARMSDFLFQFLADSFLEVDVELTSSGSGTKTAWDQAITLANIAFVIAFVIIIISQVTGAGISNYGIKRMLPRLIVAAIAVNASFWICQGMVDLSNILGHNIMEALKGIAHNVGPSAFENNQASKVNEANGFLGGLTVAVLAAAAVVWLFLAIMGGTIFIVLITCLVIIIILLMRKAFIILLIVVSPFAFVAYLLPNTEKLFSKWLNMFWQLLLVFPIVALLMGGGQLASAIILHAGSSEVVTDPTPEQEEKLRAEQEACDANDTTQSAVKNNGYEVRCEPKVQNTAVIKEPNGQERVVTKESGAMIGLIAAGVAVAPLLAVWSVMKGALAAAGAIGGKIAGAVQSGGARFGKAGGSKMGSRMDRSALGRGMAARKMDRASRREQRYSKGMSKSGWRGRGTRIATRGITGNISQIIVSADKLFTEGDGVNTRIGNKLDQRNQRIYRGAGADKAEREEAQNIMASINRSDNPIQTASDMLQDAMKSGDMVAAKASQNVLMSSGGKGMDEFIRAMGSAETAAIEKGNQALINTLKQNALQNHGSAMKEKGGAANGWAGSSATMQKIQDASSGQNPFKGLNDEQISKQTTESLRGALQNGWITKQTAERITTSSVGENLGQDQREMLNLLVENRQQNGPERPPSPPAGS